MLKQRFCENKGFTLVEMMIVMLLFVIVIMITGKIFSMLLPKTKIISKSEESNIEGVVGLEMFRRDLEQAGFGLFTDVDIPPPAYTEAASAPASNFNDVTDGIPRAIVAGNDLAANVLPGTDYLAIKATNAALNTTSQCWTSVKGAGASKFWGASDLSEARNDRVVVVSQGYYNGELQRKLIYDTGSPSSYSVAYRSDGLYSMPFAPNSNEKQYYYYGIDTGASLRAPFNRTDYMVKRVAGDVPAGCSPAAGVLYKSVMNQANGGMRDIPLLDCVADMQVVLGWNTTADPAGNAVDTYTNAIGESPQGPPPVNNQPVNDPKEIRTRLKLVKVYILAQDGGYDRNYVNTNTAMRIVEPGEAADYKLIDLTQSFYRNYHWKLYRLVVRPKNLM